MKKKREYKKKKRKRENTNHQINNEKGIITMDHIDIKQIMREYHEKLNANKF